MAYTFVERELWGGQVVVSLPNDLLDASDIRPVPDHQECFTTPSNRPIEASLVFEILEYVDHAATNSDPLGGQVTDHDAVRYHLDDLVQVPHKHDQVSAPTTHTLPAEGMAHYPAYTIEARVVEPVAEGQASSSSKLPAQDQDGTPLAYLYLLVVRMGAQATDFAVQLNVHTKEMTPARNEAALSIMAEIIRTLHFKDMTLFEEPGTEEEADDEGYHSPST